MNITGSQTITGALDINSGKVYLQNGNLTVGSVWVSSGTYIVTFGTGELVQTVTTSAKMFPVGPSTSSYNPVTLQQASGSANFGVRVEIGFDYEIGGADYVNRQWTIDNESGTPNATVTLQWNTPGDVQGISEPLQRRAFYRTTSGWGDPSGCDRYHGPVYRRPASDRN